MGYYIKYKELQSAQSTIFAQINQWSEELEHTKEKIQTVVEMEEIKGAAANSIKSYMQEVHIPLLGYMQQLFSEYMTRMLLYGDEYYKLDTQLSAKIAQDRLEEQITSLGTGVDAFLTIEDSVAAAVSMASGLASVNAPSGERITGSYEQLTKKASQLMNEVGDCEYGHLSADFGTITDLLSNLLQIVNGQRGKNHVTITSYQVGSIAQLPAFQKIKEASAKQNTELNGSTKDLEEAINRYTQKQQERNLADEKTKAGEGQILNGLLIAGAAIAGTAAIIVTFGAATPVVVGAFTIGVTSGLYGMSTANEGVNNVILGTSGDGTTVGMNPIRDTIFASNPGLYYTIGDISTMTCVLAVPIGGATASAMTAGTSVLRAVAVEGGKTVLAAVGGSATSELVYKKTNNEVLAMISGVAVGALAYGGMTKFDSVKNISGYHTKPVVENVAANAEVLKNGDNYNSFRDFMSPEELARYEKYWDNVSKGKYDIPYEMTDVEYYQYLKGLSKVDRAIKSGSRTSGFKYINNPSDNPKVLEDALEDIKAVYGYRPSATGSVKAFAEDDWSDIELVNSYRENRIQYHLENDVNIEIANTLRAEGKTDSEIARILVERRNNNRLASYIDEKGNITDIKKYNQALAHCKTYEELKRGTKVKSGKTDLDIIESSIRGNPGFDACTGLYDNYYNTYNLKE